MQTAPLIIYTHGGGRLGNQIIRHAHWLAWIQAQEGRVGLVNLAFWPFADFFVHWQQHPGCDFPFGPNRAANLARCYSKLPDWLSNHGGGLQLARAVHAAGRFWPEWQAIALNDLAGESIDLDGPEFATRVAASRVTTVSGWKIAGWRIFAEQQVELRQLFEPTPGWSRRPREFIADLRRQHNLLIGVFIRQSDYREWAEGRFYFTTAQYAGWIRQLLDLHPHRRVAIVIVSEVRQDAALFAGLPCHFATGTINAGGHWFESWLELSLCDLIVSPPSTFSATAAFMNSVPLWPLFDAEQVMNFDQVIPDHIIGAAKHPIFSLSVK